MNRLSYRQKFFTVVCPPPTGPTKIPGHMGSGVRFEGQAPKWNFFFTLRKIRWNDFRVNTLNDRYGVPFDLWNWQKSWVFILEKIGFKVFAGVALFQVHPLWGPAPLNWPLHKRLRDPHKNSFCLGAIAPCLGGDMGFCESALRPTVSENSVDRFWKF